MIEWYREAARPDASPQRFDAFVGHLYLRVVEVDDEDGIRHHYRWGVSAHEHPEHADEINELSLAMGAHVTEHGAKGACLRAVKRLLAEVGPDL